MTPPSCRRPPRAGGRAKVAPEAAERAAVNVRSGARRLAAVAAGIEAYLQTEAAAGGPGRGSVGAPAPAVTLAADRPAAASRWALAGRMELIARRQEIATRKGPSR